MTPAIQTPAAAHVSGRWLSGLLFLLASLVVLAQNSAHLDILPADADGRLADEIYNSAPGWRTPTAYENEWRRGGQQQSASRIQFGYDSAYEEMRASDNRYGMNNRLGGIDHPQNTQIRISF
jgi:hypothetical protein